MKQPWKSQPFSVISPYQRKTSLLLTELDKKSPEFTKIKRLVLNLAA